MLDERIAATNRRDRRRLVAFGFVVLIIKVAIIALAVAWIFPPTPVRGRRPPLVVVTGPSMVPTIHPASIAASCRQCGSVVRTAVEPREPICRLCGSTDVTITDVPADKIRWQPIADFQAIRRGDIVIIDHDGRWVVKRVWAIPGDVVDVLADGLLSVNGDTPSYAEHPIADDQITDHGQDVFYDDWFFNNHTVRRMNRVDPDDISGVAGHRYRKIRYRLSPGDRRNVYPMQMAGKMCFVVGDNVPVSVDSRHWGPIRTDAVIGRVSPDFEGSLPARSSRPSQRE